jgi:tetratricopeptide (TPR) repeat protein
MGDYAKAEPLFQQALQIRKKALGPEHPDTANSLNNLAFLYSRIGDYANAEPLFQEAVQLNKKLLGRDHPDTARSLLNQGVLYSQMGDYARAEPLYQEALQINQKALGPDHPDTATSLYSFALVKLDLGENLEAKSLAQLNAKAGLAILSDFGRLRRYPVERCSSVLLTMADEPAKTVARSFCFTSADVPLAFFLIESGLP